jgi:hypothetical protein
VDCKVGDVGGWQIKLQRLPVIAGIERGIDRVGSASEQESLAAGIFADRAGHAGFGQAGDDFFPSLSGVARAIEIRMHVTRCVQQRKSIMLGENCGVGGVGIVRRSFDAIDVWMLGKIGRCDIGPRRTVVGEVDKAGG